MRGGVTWGNGFVCVWKTAFWLCVRTSRVKSGKLSLINRCVPSICFTDSPSFSGSCCKTVSHKKKSPANTFSETHAYDMQVEIFDHEGGTITHTWKHTLDLAHQLHKTCSSPTALKVEPHKAAAPICTSGGAAAGGRSLLLLHSPHNPQPLLWIPSHCVRNYSTHAYATKQ